MRRWLHNILFNPPIPARIDKRDSTLIHRLLKCFEGIPCRTQIVRIARRKMRAQQQRYFTTRSSSSATPYGGVWIADNS